MLYLEDPHQVMMGIIQDTLYNELRLIFLHQSCRS